MSRLDELIQQYCPEGVEYKPLSELGRVIRGGNFQKKDFVESGKPCIHYGQIYTKYGLSTNTSLTFVNEDVWNKSKKANTGNIVMAVTSENYDDVCKCVVWEGDEPAAVSGHTAIIEHNINAKYLAYWFTSSEFYSIKLKLAHGTKVIEVTPSSLENIEIPIPPLPVQEEIVRILDKFTELEAELETELELRKKQYEYYRDKMLSFSEDVDSYPITDVFDMRNGYTPSKSNAEYWTEGTVDWFRMEDIRANGHVLDSAIQKVSESAVKGGRLFKANSIMLATSATIGEHALVKVDCLGNQRFTFFSVKDSFEKDVNMDYMNYYFYIIDEWCKAHLHHGNFASVDMDALKKLQIPIPDITEQNKIVELLDKFSTLTQDLSEGLPAEIKLRKKQYEYYRDKLLNFKKSEVVK